MARVGGNFKRLLGRLPEMVGEEIRKQHEETGRTLLSRALARAPVRSGALRSALAFRVTPKTLKLRFGILGKAKNRKLFYGRIQEFGRKAKTVIANRSGRGVRLSGNRFRRQALERGVAGFYKLRVRAMAPKRFIYNMTREQIYRPYQKIWGRAIHRAAQGAGE